MYCRKCGSKMADGAVFCPMCGEKNAAEKKQESPVFGEGRQQSGYYGNEDAYTGVSPSGVHGGGAENYFSPGDSAKNKKKPKWLIPVIAAGAVAGVFLALCFSGVIPVFSGGVMKEVAMFGNTSSNLVNYGYALETENHVYYVEGEAWTLMVEDKKTGEVTATGIEGADNLCWHDGSLYYRGLDSRIYRADEYGNNPTVVCNYGVDYFMIYEDEIYYLYSWESGGTDLCSMGMNAENDFTVLEDCGLYDFTMYDGIIYYCDPNEMYNVFSVDQLGVFANRLNYFDSDSVTPHDGWFYYINWDDGMRLYSMNEYGDKNECVLDAAVVSYNIHDGYIYYIECPADAVDLCGSVYRVPLGGGTREKVLDGEFFRVCVAGDKIVAVDYSTFCSVITDIDAIGLDSAAA